jgi:hypothetical protein
MKSTTRTGRKRAYTRAEMVEITDKVYELAARLERSGAKSFGPIAEELFDILGGERWDGDP